MKRKYDLRNKRNFIIILVLSLVIIAIFSLFIYKYQHAKKVGYDVAVGSVVQDINKNFINISEDAVLKMRWNDSYYLVYQNNKINLGKRVIVYNTVSNNLKLYGKFYEITNQGKIVDTSGETILSNLSETKFYKLADREYLLVDKTIYSQDRSINASNYLLVELDKIGNAKLSNNTLNLKTITPTKLVTSKYVFDIANETLKYNKLEIDLKKIIGTTNEYKEDVDNGTTNEKGSGNGNNQTVNNNVAGNTVITNTNEGSKNTTVDEIKDKVKTTSVVKVQAGLTQIDIDYVVYDPYNEYKSVYAEVEKAGKVEVIHLSKSETHMTIYDLLPDTDYTINFVYTAVDGKTNELKPNKFDELNVKTLKPVYSANITKFSGYSNKLSYGVNLQSGFAINKVNVTIKFYYQEIDDEGTVTIKEQVIEDTITVTGNEKIVYGQINTAGYDVVNLEKASVSVTSVSNGNTTITF